MWRSFCRTITRSSIQSSYFTQKMSKGLVLVRNLTRFTSRQADDAFVGYWCYWLHRRPCRRTASDCGVPSSRVSRCESHVGDGIADVRNVARRVEQKLGCSQRQSSVLEWNSCKLTTSSTTISLKRSKASYFYVSMSFVAEQLLQVSMPLCMSPPHFLERQASNTL